MGQMYVAIGYDLNTREAVEMDAGKFCEGCHFNSEAVISMHYLLKKQPYRIMWLGSEALQGYNLNRLKRKEDLLGASVAFYKEYYEAKHADWGEEYPEISLFISENYATWNRTSIEHQAIKELKDNGKSAVEYTGYLINHTRKEAINLVDYYNCSKGLFWNETTEEFVTVLDPIPILTDMDRGHLLAFFDGIPANVTENLAGRWAGDLLERIEDVPANEYTIIDCCFVNIYPRAKYCLSKFGIDEEGWLIANEKGELFEGVTLSFLGTRSPKVRFKMEIQEKDSGKRVVYNPVSIDKIKKTRTS